MTAQTRSKRMRWLIVSFATISGLAAILSWSAARIDHVLSRPRGVARMTGSVALNGVVYRPTREVLPLDGKDRTSTNNQQAYRANVEASDPVSGARLWKVTVREGAWHGVGGGMVAAMGPVQKHFLSGFDLKLAVQGQGVSATTPDGAVYLLDPKSRQVRQLAAPGTPPRPRIVDVSQTAWTRCEVHAQPLVEGLVPIRYGLALGEYKEYELRMMRFPHAYSSHGGGCIIGESTEARVLFCSECREAERQWVASRPGGHPSGAMAHQALDAQAPAGVAD